MRRKPMQNNNYGRQQKRHPQGRHGGHGGHGGPRKNYGASREKYLAQARDALSSGDRVMAEYYYQHAEHCFRMMAEEGQRAPRPNNQPRYDQPQDASGHDEAADYAGVNQAETDDAAQLPAFISAPPPQQQAVPVQNWEERDAE